MDNDDDDNRLVDRSVGLALYKSRSRCSNAIRWRHIGGRQQQQQQQQKSNKREKVREKKKKKKNQPSRPAVLNKRGLEG